MFLTASNSVHYLMGRGLVSRASVVDGDFLVLEAARRHRVLKVLRRNGPGYLVKQPSTTVGEKPVSLSREATFLQMVGTRPAFWAYARCVPRLLDFDPGTATLVTELVPDGESVMEFHLRVGGYPIPVAALLGQQLGACHASALPILSDPANLANYQPQLPWIFLQRRDQPFAEPSFGAAGKLLGTLLAAEPGLYERIALLAGEWRTDAITHGDMKWENLVITEHDGALSAKIVDWELANLGDAVWDTASIFAAYLSFWAWRSSQTLDADAKHLERTFAEVSSATSAFWRSYAAERRWDAAQASAELQRCMRFVAARLLLIVFESLFNVPQLTAATTGSIATVKAILSDPAVAAAQLVAA
ncbi:MAG TPA: phosphotransferase [Acidobacteriaceae bacterium]|nr:phosphotransferase [Acidobacteriaceae bacterium]